MMSATKKAKAVVVFEDAAEDKERFARACHSAAMEHGAFGATDPGQEVGDAAVFRSLAADLAADLAALSRRAHVLPKEHGAPHALRVRCSSLGR